MTQPNPVIEVALILVLVGIVYKFLLNSRKRNIGTFHSMMKDGSVTFFEFAGALTTGLEIAGLALDAYSSGRMGAFNAFSRYFTIGFLEIFMTFRYIIMCYKDIEDSYTKLIKMSRVKQMLYKLWISIKYSPFFLLGLCVTFGISLMYLESKGSLILKATGEPVFPYPWKFIEIEMVKTTNMTFTEAISSQVMSSYPQFAAFVLIYFTPFITFMLVITLLTTSTEKILEMLYREGVIDKKRYEELTNTKVEEKKDDEKKDDERRRRSHGKSDDKHDKKDDKGDEKHDDKDDNKDSEDSVVHVKTLRKYLNKLNEAFEKHNKPAFSVDDYIDSVLNLCGIKEDGSAAAIRSNTHPSVEEYIDSIGAKGKSPKDFYNEVVLPVVRGKDSLQAKFPNGYVGYQSILTKHSDVEGEYRILKDNYELAKRQYEQDRSPENKEEMISSKKSFEDFKRNKYDSSVNSFNSNLANLINHFVGSSESKLGIKL